MKHLIEAVASLIRWLMQHNLSSDIEIVIVVKDHRQMYAGNAVLEREGVYETPHLVGGRPVSGTKIAGIPVRFGVAP